MAKKRIVERERKRQILVKKYLAYRTYYKEKIKYCTNIERRLKIHIKLQRYARKGISVRVCKRCQFSGRSSGYYRDFGLSRHFFRELRQRGFLPGIQKSSW
jgi:small subunit ribosomal protein S14